MRKVEDEASHIAQMREDDAHALDAADLMLFPNGTASYQASGDMRIFAFQQLGELDTAIRGEGLVLAQMSGWLPNVEPDADLVEYIPLL